MAPLRLLTAVLAAHLAGRAGAGVGAPVEALGPADDSLGLLQRGARARRSAPAALKSHLAARKARLAARKARRAGTPAPRPRDAPPEELPPAMDPWTPFPCDRFPEYCKAPFNCQDFDEEAWWVLHRDGFAPGGVRNPHAWCLTWHIYRGAYAEKCMAGDIDGATIAELDGMGVEEIHGQTASVPGIDESHASMCFLEGYCADTAVTQNTSVEETDAMCNERFGHQNWTTFGSVEFYEEYGSLDDEIVELLVSNPWNGYPDRRLTWTFGAMSCAMGSFQCDVMMCKRTYCKMGHYHRKYSHHLKEQGWIE